MESEQDQRQKRSHQEIDKCASQLNQMHLEEQGTKKHSLFGSLTDQYSSTQSLNDEVLQQHINECLKKNYTTSDLQELLAKLNHGNLYEAHDAAIGIRKLLSLTDNHGNLVTPPSAFIRAGIVPRLIMFAKEWSYPTLQREAAWALVNLSSGTTEDCDVVAGYGAIPVFVSLLSSPQIDIVDQAIWGLGNLAGDCSRLRDLVAATGAVDLLVQLATNIMNAIKSNAPNANASILRLSVWALSNLSRGSPRPAYESVKGVVPVFVRAITMPQVNSDDILSDSLWSLAYMLEHSITQSDKWIPNSGAVQHLVSFLGRDQIAIIIPTLRILGHILIGPRCNELNDEMMHEPILDRILLAISHHKKAIRRESVWLLSNLACHNYDNVVKILSHQALVSKLVNLHENDNVQVKIETVFVLYNILNKLTPADVVAFCKQHNILRAIANNLKIPDQKSVLKVLELLKLVLSVGRTAQAAAGASNQMLGSFEAAGGTSILENLQMSPHQSVYKKAVEIISEFYEAQ